MSRKRGYSYSKVGYQAAKGFLVGNIPVGLAAGYQEHVNQTKMRAVERKRKHEDGQNDRYQHKIQKVRPQLSIRTDSVTLSQNKKMKYSTNPNKKLVNRSAMSVKGKVKVKKTKKVDVPDLLRKQIKQVLVGQQSTGSYTTIKQGYVGSLLPTAQTTLTIADLGITQAAVIANTSTAIPGRTLFNCLVNRGPSLVAVESTVIAGTGLNFFTPGKIIDAASVLFNQKAANINPYLRNGNLSTTFNPANGVPDPNKPGNLKINVLNSYVEFTMKNLSNRVVNMEIWECVPVQMFQDNNPIATLESVLRDNMTVAAGDTSLEYIDNLGLNATRLVHEVKVDPLELCKKHFDYKWTWKKRAMVLAPQETCIHSIQGPKGVFDYKKLLTTAGGGVTANPVIKENALVKGWSVGVAIGVYGDQVLPQPAAGVLSTGGRKTYPGGLAAGYLGMPVHIEVVESYKLAVPEIAGFVTGAFVAGSSQMLNQRKFKKIVWNLCETGNNAYSVGNEVNPVFQSGFPSVDN